jgi:hypothetical protein
MSDEYNPELKPYCGRRVRVSGTFERFGCRYDSYGRSVDTVLLRHVTLDPRSAIVAEHTWLPAARGFRDLGLEPGDRVAFEASVRTYRKRVVREGPYRFVNAFGLCNPSDIRLLAKLTSPMGPVVQDLGDDCEPCEGGAAEEAVATEAREGRSHGMPADPVAVVSAVRRSAELAGGWGRLRQWVDLLAESEVTNGVWQITRAAAAG